MFVMGMLAGAVVVALLAFVAMVAKVVRFGMTVRCDTCGKFAPGGPQPLVTERHAGGVRVKRPATPQGWRELPDGQHECDVCRAASLIQAVAQDGAA